MRFAEIEQRIRGGARRTIVLAGADDPAALAALGMAMNERIARGICVGPAAETAKVAAQLDFDLSRVHFIPAETASEMAQVAFKLAVAGDADAVMKGHLVTSDLLHIAVQPELGFRRGPIISHIAAFELPTYSKLLFITDTGVVINPDLEQKAGILANVLDFVRGLGLPLPAAALLSASEIPTSKLRCSTDAAALTVMASAGRFGQCSVFGPLDLASAINAEAARCKRIGWPHAGGADILLVPEMSGGNILGKALIHLANARAGGVAVGGKTPVILMSRAASADDKWNSIILGLAVGQGQGN